jgi:hypothetical protein
VRALLLWLALAAKAEPFDKPALDRLFDGFRALTTPAPVPNVSPSTVRPGSVDLLLELARENRADPVWPGYEVLAQPILLYRPGVGSWLIGHPAPPPDFAAIPGSPAPFRPGEIPDLGMSYQLHRAIGGVDAFVYRQESGESDEQAAKTSVHERFHVFESKAFARARGREPGEAGEESVALAALEQKILSAALGAQGLERERLIRQFVGVRRHRWDAGGAPLIYLETREERSEGMARYVDLSLLARVGRGAAPGDAVRRRLDDFPSVESMKKHRHYESGAAQGLLLDWAGVSDWKARVAAGAAPSDLLAAAFPVSSPKELAAQAKAEHAYAALQARAAEVVEAYRLEKAKALAAYKAQAGVELILVIPYEDDSDNGFEAESPEYELPEGDFRPNMRLVDMRGGGYVVHVVDRATIWGGDLRFFAEIESLKIDGAATPPRSYRGGPFKSLSLRARGVELDFDRPGEVSLSGGAFTISVREKTPRP